MTTPREYRAIVLKQIEEAWTRFNFSPKVGKNLMEYAPPDNAAFSGKALIGLEDIGCNNPCYTTWMRKVIGIFKKGQLERTFSQAQALASFDERWDVDKLVSAAMVIPLVRVKWKSEDIYFIGLAPNRTPGMGSYWKGAGGYVSDKTPGDRKQFDRYIPRIDFIENSLMYVNPFQVAALAELREELTGSRKPSWIVLTGMFPQEPCHSGQYYGSMGVGFEVSSISEIEGIQGEEPDLGQGKTHWFPLDERPPLWMSLRHFADELGKSEKTNQLPHQDPQTCTAIHNLARVVFEYDRMEGDWSAWENLQRLHPR